ncbi:transposase [Ectorhizobium quercum]|uniref:transposase n=1 Tax=Ectorhizobium quercum TaxID=2965071 RepID=UPI003520B8FF
MLKEQESGQRTTDVCRQHGISEATFTNTRRSMAAWMSPTPGSSRPWKTRTPS